MGPNQSDGSSIITHHPHKSDLAIVAMLLSLLLLSTEAMAVDADKKAHFGTGAGLGVIVGTATYRLATEMGPPQRMATTTGLSLIPGVVNEFYDKYALHVGFSWADIAADGLGAATGAIAAELFNGHLWLSASGKQINLRGVW